MEWNSNAERPLFYCKSWFRAKKRPTELWANEIAREAHDAGRPYDVLVDSIEKPFCFVTVTRGFVGVNFLDKHLRVSLDYGFSELEPGTLFLKDATHREFEGAKDAAVKGTTYHFETDGLARVTRRDMRLGVQDISEMIVDVSANYERWPEFGCYAHLITVERAI